MTLRKPAALLAFFCAAAAGPAYACSVVGDYVRPSNFELVQIADAIVIATPEAEDASDTDGAVVFRVESSVKGVAPERLSLGRAVLGRPSPSELSDLSGSHPEGHAGPCNRMSFAKDGRYLLFLERDGERWRMLSFPFSRVNEDYAGEDNGWVRSVRRYLRLQESLSPMEQIAALRQMAESGREPGGTELSRDERADIADHLGSISQWKPTGFLLGLYERLERGEPLPFESRPQAANREQSNADQLAVALLGRPLPQAPVGADGERLAILRALAEGDHPGALALFERLSGSAETRGALRGLVLRYFARNGQYARAYQWIETRLLAELPRLPRGEAQALVVDVAQVQRGDTFGEGQERWRTDPRASATWPELALALHWYQMNTVGPDRLIGFSDAIAAIETPDYRARPEVALALASGYDGGVRRWARTELERAALTPTVNARETEADERSEDPALLPMRILVSAWAEEDRPLLVRAFCQGGERRQRVIHALGQWGDHLYMDLLASMAATPRLSDEDHSVLIRAAIEMTARGISDTGDAPDLSYDESEWLVSRLLRRQAIGVPPISCETEG
jgi:hypothetical protein